MRPRGHIAHGAPVAEQPGFYWQAVAGMPGTFVAVQRHGPGVGAFVCLGSAGGLGGLRPIPDSPLLTAAELRSKSRAVHRAFLALEDEAARVRERLPQTLVTRIARELASWRETGRNLLFPEGLSSTELSIRQTSQILLGEYVTNLNRLEAELARAIAVPESEPTPAPAPSSKPNTKPMQPEEGSGSNTVAMLLVGLGVGTAFYLATRD